MPYFLKVNPVTTWARLLVAFGRSAQPPPDNIGQYQILRKLGEGGMDVV